MANLLSLQKDFLEDFQGQSTFTKHVKHGGLAPRHRVSVYHNNITQALRKTLSIIYPLTWKLIGEACANGAAYAFIQDSNSLPQTSILDEWGANFPAFLESFPPTKSLGYLPDFARLEWKKHEAYCAEDSDSLKGSDFNEISPDRNGSLLLTLHPSARLLSSPFPLDQVINVATGQLDTATLEKRGSYALVLRPDKSVHTYWLSKPSFDFFSDLQRGLSLKEALERRDDELFEFQKVFLFSLEIKLFSHYAFL